MFWRWSYHRFPSWSHLRFGGADKLDNLIHEDFDHNSYIHKKHNIHTTVLKKDFNLLQAPKKLFLPALFDPRLKRTSWMEMEDLPKISWIPCLISSRETPTVISLDVFFPDSRKHTNQPTYVFGNSFHLGGWGWGMLQGYVGKSFGFFHGPTNCLHAAVFVDFFFCAAEGQESLSKVSGLD